MTAPSVVVSAAAEAGVVLAVAESLTGGGLCSSLVSVPGASQVLLGGVVAYTVAAKRELLGVDGAMLEQSGPVSEQVALAMASGVRVRLGADIGVSTTGVAGPEPHDGQAPGTVWIGVATATGAMARRYRFEGGREDVRSAAIDQALATVLEALSEVSHA